MRKNALPAIFVTVTVLGFSCGAARTTMLEFDITETSGGGWVGSFSGEPRDYADRVAAFSTASGTSTYRYGGVEGPTPRIEVGHGPHVAAVDLWDYNNGDLNRIILPYNNGIGILEIILTTGPIYKLDLHRLNMEVWSVPIAPPVSSRW